MKKILVIGSANADLTIHTDRMPKLGETVTGFNFSLNSGGKGANQAIACAKLGGDVRFLGVLGNDAYGQKLLDDLKSVGIVFKGIVSDNTTTGTASITVVNGDNFIILNEGANALLTPEIIFKNEMLIKEADYLIMQLEIPVESVLCAARIANKNGTKVILNPAPYKEIPEELLMLTDIIIPNEHEARLLTGFDTDNESGCRAAIKTLTEKGTETVIITLGSKGCIYNVGENILTCPAEETNVVDTTSAGDTFIGALCCKLTEEKTLSEAIRYAVKAAAITVSRNGASCSIPFADEIK